MARLILIVAFLFNLNSTSQFDKLSSVLRVIRTIDPNDENFDDLIFLKEKLKNVNVVLLGSGTHTSKTDGEAKLRLIKFLHQNLAFDLLLIEQGFLKCIR